MTDFGGFQPEKIDRVLVNAASGAFLGANPSPPALGAGNTNSLIQVRSRRSPVTRHHVR